MSDEPTPQTPEQDAAAWADHMMARVVPRVIALADRLGNVPASTGLDPWEMALRLLELDATLHSQEQTRQMIAQILTGAVQPAIRSPRIMTPADLPPRGRGPGPASGG